MSNISTSGPRESVIVRSLKQHYESRGAFVVKLHGSAYQRAGLPDLLVLTRDGMTRWIEVKRPGRKLTRIQERVIESICKCGGLVFVSHGKPPF